MDCEFSVYKSSRRVGFASTALLPHPAQKMDLEANDAPLHRQHNEQQTEEASTMDPEGKLVGTSTPAASVLLVRSDGLFDFSSPV